MKRPKNNVIYIGLVLSLLFFAACEHELLKEYESISLPGAPTLEANISGVQDSAFVLNYTLGGPGWLSVAVVPGSDLDVPSQENMKFRNVTGAVRTFHFEVEGGGSGTLVVDSLLKQNTTYTVFAMPTSVDGISGSVWASTLTTTDGNFPVPVDVTPAIASSATQDLDFEVEITFDEAVMVENEAGFVFRYLNIVTLEYAEVPAESVTVQGNTITLVQGHEPVPGQYVFLTILPETVKDLTGNFHPGVSSGFTPAFDDIFGLYWRTAFIPLEYEGVLPDTDDAVQDEDFVVELFYSLPMDFYRGTGNAVVYNQKHVQVSYTMGPTTIIVEVPQDHISFDSNVVTIVPPRTPVFGETISVAVDSAAFRTRYGSPVAEIPFGEIEWLLSYGYTRDIVVGDFAVSFINQANEFVRTTPANIEAGSNDNMLIVNELAKGYFGLETDIPIEGVFNGDFATIAIADEQVMGEFDHPAVGLGTIYFANRFTFDPVIGNIDENGNITMGGWGFLFNFNEGDSWGWVAQFNNTTWEKSTGKLLINSADNHDPMVIVPAERNRK